MRRDDNRIVARLEDEQPYEEAEKRDEDARKESCPESRYLEAGYNRWHQKHHQRIDHKQEKSEGEYRQRDGQQDDDRSDDRIG